MKEKNEQNMTEKAKENMTERKEENMNTNTVIKMENLEIEGMQTREGVNDAVVRSYAREMADGVVFDPPVVFFDGTKHYLADGFHRIAAMKRRGETEVAVEVREGTRTDALRFALTANAKHGLKRTPADIHHCLEVAWQNRVELFGGEPSHEILARACAVSVRTVIRFLKRRAMSTSDSVTSSGTVTAGESSTSDTVTSSESVTLVSIDGKKRNSTKGTRRQPAKAAITSEKSSDARDDAKKPAPKVRSTLDEDPVEDPVGFGRNVFKSFCDKDGEKARDAYIASEYGTFGKDLDSEWKKDRCGTRVPEHLRKIVGLPILDDFAMLFSCINRAYTILECDEDAPFMKELLNSKCKPLESIKRIYEAIRDADLMCVCTHCHGKGCIKCRYKGYLTWGDSRRNFREQRERREAEAHAAEIQAKLADKAKGVQMPAETPVAAKPTEEAPRKRLPWEVAPGTKQGDWEPIEDIMDQTEAVAF